MSLNPEREQSPRPQKRVCTGTPLVPCGGGLELKDGYGDKSVFVCSFETYRQPIDIPIGSIQPLDFAYVVRSIKLADLLSPSLSEKVELRQVANLVDEHLPDECACGVLGSKIVFAGGLKPNLDPPVF